VLPSSSCAFKSLAIILLELLKILKLVNKKIYIIFFTFGEDFFEDFETRSFGSET
jgi:hypothetical protein